MIRNNDISVLEMLSIIYEELDIDTIEERFVDITQEVFQFDRLALFFMKHKKGVLQGKIARGFPESLIQGMELPIAEQHLLTRPLITGFPLWNEPAAGDPQATALDLREFAVIPIINRKRIPCWKVNDCKAVDCPAYGRKWLRCWLVSGTKCSIGTDLSEEIKVTRCADCPIFRDQKTDMAEGILLVDNSLSGAPIAAEDITVISVIAHSVGVAVNNSKLYSRTLKEAIKDDLTGLHNRRFFNERLLDEIERVKRYGEGGVSLLIADIDHFKRVNDEYGHQTGDAVLRWLGKIFPAKLRKSDVVARLGGEEFAVLLINSRREEAFGIAEDLRCTIADASLKDLGIRVTASFGVATMGEDAMSLDGLMDRADKALYSAKAQGRNRVCSAAGRPGAAP